MNTRKSALILAFLGLMLSPIFVSASVSDSRYFVKTNSQIWRKSFGVRQSFDDGFSTNLGVAQLRLAKIFNVPIEPVGRFYVLPEDTETESLKTPTSSITWGTSRMLGNTITVDSGAGKGIKIAILDTGVYTDHEDLKNRISDCADFSAKSAVSDDKCEDKNGHGTHVAGIIAADGGPIGKGIYGFAPSAEILAYKVCDNSGVCYGDDIAAAIERAITAEANIINLSIGSEKESTVVKNAIEKAVSKGILVVASAGNDGPYDGSIDFPASMASVVSVGAIDSDDDIVDWSSRGNNIITKTGVIENGDIEFAAPGSGIESTWNDGKYSVLSGTSMSAPHISGLAARLWKVDGEKQAISIRSALRKLAEDIGEIGEDSGSGFGLPTLTQ